MNKPKPQIDSNGNKVWYLNGKFHREDGSACEYANGDKYWYLNGKLHRIDGPAIEYADGDKYWYLNGKRLPIFMLSKFCIRIAKKRYFPNTES